MSEDYFDVACISSGKAILHGRRADGTEVERELDFQERELVERMAAKHDAQMQSLLRGLAGEFEIVAAPKAA